MLILLFICATTSCSKDEDQLIGSWSRCFGLNTNSYTQYRAFHDKDIHPTYFHTFVFEKGTGDKGIFKDVVKALILSGTQRVSVGSKLSGNWEVRNGKLYLYYDDTMQLLDADDLNTELIAILEEAVKDKFLSKFKEAGKNGYEYTLKKVRDKDVLEIDLGSETLTLKKEVNG